MKRDDKDDKETLSSLTNITPLKSFTFHAQKKNPVSSGLFKVLIIGKHDYHISIPWIVHRTHKILTT